MKYVFAILALFLTLAHNPANAYELGAGDRLRVQVLERPELTSTYVVDQDGAISIPGVGVVVAAGKELREFETDLRERLSGAIIAPSVAVQLDEARPFFVLGSVRTPGAYPYRAGLLVLQAVAIAGGQRRSELADSGLTGALSGISAEQGADANLRSILAVQVRIARLKAELAGQDDFSTEGINVPARLEAELPALVESEKALMDARSKEQKSRIEVLDESIRIRTAELDSYDEQLVSKRELLDVVGEELAAARSLQDRGLATRDRFTELLRDQASAASSIIQTETLLNQARAVMAELRERRIALETGFQVDIQAQLRVALDELAQARSQLKANEAIIEVTGAGDVYGGSDDATDYVYTIQRGGALLTDAVGPETELLPDDVLIVARPTSTGPLTE